MCIRDSLQSFPTFRKINPLLHRVEVHLSLIHISLVVYKPYTEENLRYSLNAPLNMYDAVNAKCNLPAQIDIEATEGLSLIHI